MSLARPDRITWMCGLATVVAARSEDPYVQVGSLAVREDWSIAGIGYNGLPSGVDMPDEWWRQRDERRPFMIHAEVNALRYARAGEIKRIVTTHIPCASCMSLLGSYHIDEVYYVNLLGEAHDLETIIKIATLNRIWLHNVSLETVNATIPEPPATNGQPRETWGPE